jgi:methylglutaconyl-CoA hydratase
MTVTYAVDSGVATITLASPESRNVLTAESMRALVEHLSAAANDDAVRVVVLTGEGNTFCAGADLLGASSADADSFAARGPRALVAVLETMLLLPKPIVARVQGHVAGGGNGLVAAADLAVAAESAKFAFSEVRVGVAPAVISVVCLARMTPSYARELLLTGERVTAHRVLEAGLLTAVAADDALDAVVSTYVDQLLLGGPEALARTKELLRRVPGMPHDEAFTWTAELSASLFSSTEAREGMSAFLERRKPSWAPPA